MLTIKSSLTIIFDPPFYKAIFERRYASVYEVGQVTLGTSEPKLTYIYTLVTNHWSRVVFFRQSDSNALVLEKRINPKRLQRLARKSVEKGVSTKAQLALQKQIEIRKTKKKQIKQAGREAKEVLAFEMRQAKKKQKHKGH
ncbi:MAG: YjdF family protein [Liquorilactobacillus sp.]|uniref:YjdF family protein n=1 Tax=Liquorilactobacillus sp. TaxID=2767923 RepID=UPI0039ECC0B0